MIAFVSSLKHVALTVIALAALLGQASADHAIVHLKRSASIDHDVVVLGDVAEVTASTAALEKRLKALDLLDREGAGKNESVSARHIQARLLIAGIDRRSVTVTGETECQVSFESQQVVQTSAVLTPPERTNPGPGPSDNLALQAVDALAKVWLAAPNDVEVKVVSSPADSQQAIPGATPELELPARVEPGRVQAKVRWLRDGKIERVDQFTFEARLRQTVVLAAHNVDRGVPLKLQDLVEDRRLLNTRTEQFRAEQVVGLIARRGLNQGDQITGKDLAAPRTAPMIQARSGVRVVAKKGMLSVTLQMAEALEPGNKGEVIRLRNLQSGQIITGRVVSSQEVEIPLH